MVMKVWSLLSIITLLSDVSLTPPALRKRKAAGKRKLGIPVTETLSSIDENGFPM